MGIRPLPLGVLALIVFAAIGTAQVRADGSRSVAYSNGDVAAAAEECRPGDVCATIKLASGDVVKVLTGDSGKCNPYVMTFMRYHGSDLAAIWSTPTDRNPDTPSGGPFGGGPKCGGFHNTHMFLDHGAIDMGIFQKRDGLVFVLFFGGKPGPAPPASDQSP
jgi:hypothetical protein